MDDINNINENQDITPDENKEIKLDPMAEAIVNEANEIEKSKEESTVEKVDGETVPPIPPQFDENGNPIPTMPNMSGDALASGLTSLLGGGGGSEYNELFKQQMTLFERFDQNINKLDDNIAIVNEDLEDTKSEIEAIKLYSRILTWVMLGIDLAVVIAVILIIIFK